MARHLMCTYFVVSENVHKSRALVDFIAFLCMHNFECVFVYKHKNVVLLCNAECWAIRFELLLFYFAFFFVQFFLSVSIINSAYLEKARAAIAYAHENVFLSTNARMTREQAKTITTRKKGMQFLCFRVEGQTERHTHTHTHTCTLGRIVISTI